MKRIKYLFFIIIFLFSFFLNISINVFTLKANTINHIDLQFNETTLYDSNENIQNGNITITDNLYLYENFNNNSLGVSGTDIDLIDKLGYPLLPFVNIEIDDFYEPNIPYLLIRDVDPANLLSGIHFTDIRTNYTINLTFRINTVSHEHISISTKDLSSNDITYIRITNTAIWNSTNVIYTFPFQNDVLYTLQIDNYIHNNSYVVRFNSQNLVNNFLNSINTKITQILFRNQLGGSDCFIYFKQIQIYYPSSTIVFNTTYFKSVDANCFRNLNMLFNIDDNITFYTGTTYYFNKSLAISSANYNYLSNNSIMYKNIKEIFDKTSIQHKYLFVHFKRSINYMKYLRFSYKMYLNYSENNGYITYNENPTKYNEIYGILENSQYVLYNTSKFYYNYVYIHDNQLRYHIHALNGTLNYLYTNILLHERISVSQRSYLEFRATNTFETFDKSSIEISAIIGGWENPNDFINEIFYTQPFQVQYRFKFHILLNDTHKLFQTVRLGTTLNNTLYNDIYDINYTFSNIRFIIYDTQFVPQTIALINLIAPFTILFVPSLAVSFYSDEKRLMIPFFIFLSLVLYATSLIPFWLFVVIIITMGLLMLITEKQKGFD